LYYNDDGKCGIEINYTDMNMFDASRSQLLRDKSELEFHSHQRLREMALQIKQQISQQYTNKLLALKGIIEQMQQKHLRIIK